MKIVIVRICRSFAANPAIVGLDFDVFNEKFDS